MNSNVVILPKPEEQPLRDYEAEVVLRVNMEMDAESKSDMENYIFAMVEMLQEEWGFDFSIISHNINKV
jgi:hypothetical protein